MWQEIVSYGACKNMYKVYCYTNKTNGKKYIGITHRTLHQRHVSHLYEAMNEKCATYNTPFKRAIRKYGIENFQLDLLDCVETKDEACDLEIKYIKDLKTYYLFANSNGYNATIGGELIIRPKDRVLKIGKDYSIIEIYDSVSDAELKNPGDIYLCVNNIDKKYTANNFCWLYEKDYLSMSKDDIVLFVDNKMQPLYQLDSSMNIIKKWDGPKYAAKSLMLNQSNISMCANGMRTQCGGYYWMYCHDYFDNKKIRKNKTNKKRILQFSKNGSFIASFESVTDAANLFNSTASTFVKSLKSPNQSKETAYGYVWFYESLYDNNGFVLAIDKTRKSVYSVNEFGEKEYFSSVCDAARKVGVKPSGIFRSLNNGCRSAKRRWYYSNKEGDVVYEISSH